MSPDALDFLKLTAFYLFLVAGACLLDKWRFFGDGTSFDRLLSGERREYRDAP